MKKVIALASALSLFGLPAFSGTSIYEQNCRFRERPDSTFVENSGRCEVIFSMNMGHYYQKIRFNSHRQYEVEGGDAYLTWEKAPASLNGRPAKATYQDGWWCWTAYKPFHEVCTK